MYSSQIHQSDKSLHQIRKSLLVIPGKRFALTNISNLFHPCHLTRHFVQNQASQKELQKILCCWWFVIIYFIEWKDFFFAVTQMWISPLCTPTSPVHFQTTRELKNKPPAPLRLTYCVPKVQVYIINIMMELKGEDVVHSILFIGL